MRYNRFAPPPVITLPMMKYSIAFLVSLLSQLGMSDTYYVVQHPCLKDLNAYVILTLTGGWFLKSYDLVTENVEIDPIEDVHIYGSHVDFIYSEEHFSLPIADDSSEASPE